MSDKRLIKILSIICQLLLFVMLICTNEGNGDREIAAITVLLVIINLLI